MNFVWSQFTRFSKDVWSRIKVSETAALDLKAGSGKIADWVGSLLGFYFTSVIGIAVVSVQVKTELPFVFHFLYLSIFLGFFSLLLAEFAKFKSTFPNQLLHILILVFLTLGFILAISISFPFYFKLGSFVLFLAVVFLMSWCATISTTEPLCC